MSKKTEKNPKDAVSEKTHAIAKLLKALKGSKREQKLRRSLCSAPWVEIVIAGGAYAPRVQCQCKKCLKVKRKWPAPVMVGPISFECLIELGAIRTDDEIGSHSVGTRQMVRAADA